MRATFSPSLPRERAFSAKSIAGAISAPRQSLNRLLDTGAYDLRRRTQMDLSDSRRAGRIQAVSTDLVEPELTVRDPGRAQLATRALPPKLDGEKMLRYSSYNRIPELNYTRPRRGVST